MPYITIANAKRSIEDIEFIDDSLFSMQTLFEREIDFLNQKEKKELLKLKCFLEKPDYFLSDVYSHVKKRSENTNLVFKSNSPPAYHKNPSCESLKSDYINFRFPLGLSKDQKKDYIEWMQENRQLEESNTEAFKARHFARWGTAYFKVKHDNSGVELIENESLLDIKTSIKSLIEKSITYNLTLEEKKESKYFYGLDENLRSEKMKFNKEIKKPLIRNLKEFYRLKLNPKLNFDRKILEQLGFKQCKICYYSVIYNSDNLTDLSKKVEEIPESKLHPPIDYDPFKVSSIPKSDRKYKYGKKNVTPSGVKWNIWYCESCWKKESKKVVESKWFKKHGDFYCPKCWQENIKRDIEQKNNEQKQQFQNIIMFLILTTPGAFFTSYFLGFSAETFIISFLLWSFTVLIVLTR